MVRLLLLFPCVYSILIWSIHVSPTDQSILDRVPPNSLRSFGVFALNNTFCNIYNLFTVNNTTSHSSTNCNILYFFNQIIIQQIRSTSLFKRNVTSAGIFKFSFPRVYCSSVKILLVTLTWQKTFL